MPIYAEAARAPRAATATTTMTMPRPRTGTGNGATQAVMARPTARLRRAARITQTMGWRDVLQSFAHDAAEMPIVARLLGAQVVLGLGYISLRGVRALLKRTPARARRRRLLVGLTAATGAVAAWTALVLIARTRAAPAVTAFFTYGHALRQYFPSWRSLTHAVWSRVNMRPQ